VGAPGAPGALREGSAFIFGNTGSTWRQLDTLSVSGSSSFGRSVDISETGAFAIIGAVGSASIFRRLDAAYNWRSSKQVSGATASFGTSVAISGIQAAIGDFGTTLFRGAVYIHSFDFAWEPTSIIEASDGAFNDRFGAAVAMDERSLIVGAYGNEGRPGSAYVFSQDDWQLVSKLVSPVSRPQDQFGLSVSIKGTSAMVGSLAVDASSGAAFVFSQDRGGFNDWGLAKEVVVSGRSAGDELGCAVAVDEKFAVVGARGRDNGALANAGAAFVFEALLGWKHSQTSEILSLDEVVSALKEEDALHQFQMSSLSVNLTTLQATVLQLSKAITSIEGRMTACEVTTAHQADVISGLKENVTLLDDKIVDLRLSDSEQHSSIANLNMSMTGLETEIETQSAKIAFVQNSNDAQKAAIATLERDLRFQGSDIASLEDSFSSLKTTLQNITALLANVKFKEDNKKDKKN